MLDALSPLLKSSDKSFWHGYLDFYEMHLPKELTGVAVEFGVFKGHSIRWLAEKYPAVAIIGVDILLEQAEWPKLDRISYRQVDQDSEQQVASFFAGIEAPTLIIEDGSHFPAHQSRCLRHGLKSLQPGGCYVLEDIHTSHPENDLYQREFAKVQQRHPSWLSRVKAVEKATAAQTSLSVLLAMEHLRRTGKKEFSTEILERLANGSHFSRDDILEIDAQIDAIHVYKRATLPQSCWRCGRSDFDYNAYRCLCSAGLMGAADSMSIVVTKKL